MAFKQFGEIETDSNPEPDRTNNVRCIAFGCPLPGAISDSTRGGGPWLCRMHFGTSPSEFQEVTRKVRHRLANGLPLESEGPTQTVREMLERVKRSQKVETPSR